MKVRFIKNHKIKNTAYLKDSVVEMLGWQYNNLKSKGVVELYDEKKSYDQAREYDKEIVLKTIKQE